MAAYSAIVVALISGPIMWLLYRLEKKNTNEHGQVITLLATVKNDIKEVKDMQVWMDLKLDRHVEQEHNA